MIPILDDKPQPAWHPRPTGPGTWICWRLNRGFVPIELNELAVKRGEPFNADLVYGPIPEPPKELTRDLNDVR